MLLCGFWGICFVRGTVGRERDRAGVGVLVGLLVLGTTTR